MNNFNTLSQGSSQSISEDSRCKGPKKKEDDKLYKLNQKIENIKSSYNTFTTSHGSNS
jgi:hypothetical protein